jgi:hypothetical protein
MRVKLSLVRIIDEFKFEYLFEEYSASNTDILKLLNAQINQEELYYSIECKLLK